MFEKIIKVEYFFSILFFFIFLNISLAVNIKEKNVFQGDVALIEISDFQKGEILKNVSVDKEKIFLYSKKNIFYPIFGIGLKEKIGEKKILVETNLGKYEGKIFVLERFIPKEDFVFSTSTTGTSTKEKENFNNNYLKILNKENQELNNLFSNDKIILKNNFQEPVKNIFITDVYGYNRNLKNNSLITHKGLDYRAKIGTKIFAINDGVVRLSKKFEIYGNTIIVDHGQGLFSLYMHLSKRKVKVGDKIKAGQEIGLSGASGYVVGPHLHLSIRLNKESIDPKKFFEIVESLK